jgi:hypothetical protein
MVSFMRGSIAALAVALVLTCGEVRAQDNANGAVDGHFQEEEVYWSRLVQETLSIVTDSPSASPSSGPTGSCGVDVSFLNQCG